MSREDALPLVRFINRYDERYRAEALFPHRLEVEEGTRTVATVTRAKQYLGDFWTGGREL